MVRGDKKIAHAGSPAGSQEEGGEIEKIIQEIEDLEKSMDSDDEAEALVEALESTDPNKPAPTPGPTRESVPIPDPEEQKVAAHVSNVTPIRGSTKGSGQPSHPDAVAQSEGSLDLKVGGCAHVSLEFARSGVTVSLTCNDDGLTICTDQGAEFRIPFKVSA